MNLQVKLHELKEKKQRLKVIIDSKTPEEDFIAGIVKTVGLDYVEIETSKANDSTIIPFNKIKYINIF